MEKTCHGMWRADTIDNTNIIRGVALRIQQWRLCYFWLHIKSDPPQSRPITCGINRYWFSQICTRNQTKSGPPVRCIDSFSPVLTARAQLQREPKIWSPSEFAHQINFSKAIEDEANATKYQCMRMWSRPLTHRWSKVQHMLVPPTHNWDGWFAQLETFVVLSNQPARRDRTGWSQHYSGWPGE